jgi:hypothetical protein
LPITVAAPQRAHSSLHVSPGASVANTSVSFTTVKPQRGHGGNDLRIIAEPYAVGLDSQVQIGYTFGMNSPVVKIRVTAPQQARLLRLTGAATVAEALRRLVARATGLPQRRPGRPATKPSSKL